MTTPIKVALIGLGGTVLATIASAIIERTKKPATAAISTIVEDHSIHANTTTSTTSTNSSNVATTDDHSVHIGVQNVVAPATPPTIVRRLTGEYSSQKQVAVVLRESVQGEIDRAQQASGALTDAIERVRRGENFPLLPTGFDILHNSNLYRDVRPKVGILPADVVKVVEKFDFQLEQVRFARDLNRKGLEDSKGDASKGGFVEAYQQMLAKLVVAGTAVLTAIDKHYPRIDH